jgi:hypothetical protein
MTPAHRRYSRKERSTLTPLKERTLCTEAGVIHTPKALMHGPSELLGHLEKSGQEHLCHRNDRSHEGDGVDAMNCEMLADEEERRGSVHTDLC